MFDIKSYMHTEQTERSLSQVSLYGKYASKNYPNEQLAKNEVEISGGQKTDGEESNMWKRLEEEHTAPQPCQPERLVTLSFLLDYSYCDRD